MRKTLENKLAKLNSETEGIFEKLQLIELNSLQKNGKGWSIIQVLSHLEMAESASLGYMKKKILAGSEMGRTKALYKFKMEITNLLLQSSLKWKAPSQVSNPEGSYSLDEIREKWKTTRSSLKDYINEYPEELLDKAVYKHPMAGRQGLEQAIDSFIYHQRHHMHQIKRIRKELNI